MMLLAVDIGNTHTVLGVFDGEELKRSFRIKTDRDKTSDELSILIRQLLESAKLPLSSVESSVVCSVVPPMLNSVRQALSQTIGHCPLVIEPGVRTGIVIRMDNPREVGADRVVNAVAALEEPLVRERGGAVVVDFGTATTFDCVSPAGEYIGGVISPGMLIGGEALASRTAKLPRIDLAFPSTVLGKNTAHAIAAGLTYGYVDMVDGLVARLRAELGFPVAVLATGGLSKLIAQHSRSIELVDEHLTLKGLRIIHGRNAGTKG